MGLRWKRLREQRKYTYRSVRTAHGRTRALSSRCSNMSHFIEAEISYLVNDGPEHIVRGRRTEGDTTKVKIRDVEEEDKVSAALTKVRLHPCKGCSATDGSP